MKTHLLCLTVDTDPDGLSGKIIDRQTLKWEGLEHLQRLPDELGAFPGLGRIPVTWFIRADGQLESILGSSAYLLETYDAFWTRIKKTGDEVAWHPHLYRQTKAGEPVEIITDPQQAQDELERLWIGLQTSFSPRGFRNGEGWHSPGTYAMVERLGFRCDSTAIPGRRGSDGHPMNWEGAPNQPYFPSTQDLCQPGPQRALLELPMNTWQLQGPHETAPRLRYMNPAVHPYLFANSLKDWENACRLAAGELCIWVMIFHPDEVLATQGDDALYSRSIEALCANLASMEESLRRLNHNFEWCTVSDAAERFLNHQKRRTA